MVARCRAAQAKGDVVGLSAITVSELEFGAYKSGDYDTEIVAVRKILTPFKCSITTARPALRITGASGTIWNKAAR